MYKLLESTLIGLYPGSLTHVFVGVIIAVFGIVLYHHRDGRALGTTSRPDLYLVPGGWPLLGHLLQVLTSKEGQIGLRDRQNEWWTMQRENAKMKGIDRPLSITFPFLRILDSSDPAIIEHIQKTKFDAYEKGWRTKSILGDAFGNGIFAVDDEQWRVQRKATAKIFTNTNFRTIITNSLRADLETLHSVLNNYSATGEEFDLSALFHAFTLSSFSHMAFGLQIGVLTTEGVQNVPFASAFDFAQTTMSYRTLNPFWRLCEKFSSDGKKMKDACKTLDEFAYGVIDQRANDGTAGHEGDLLSLYLAIRDEDGKGLDRQVLRDAILNLIIAGRDTTAQQLSWAYFHLISKPELVQPMRAEADRFPSVCFDNYKELVETNAVFHESLRLHPSVSRGGKSCRVDVDVLPTGIRVERGDFVRWSDWQSGRDPSLWGKDASSFKPSRWIGKDGELERASPWKLHAFNGGPRICLGSQLATYEATMVLASIVKDFDIIAAPDYLDKVGMINVPSGEQTPRYRPSITLPMLEPLRVIVRRRDDVRD